MHKRHKGMTLTEVVISVMLLGFIGIFFISAIGNGIKMLSSEKSKTESYFAAMQKLELKSQSIKKDIENKKTISESSMYYGLFSGKYARNIKFYPISVNVNADSRFGDEYITDLSLIVAENQTDAFPTAKIENLNVTPKISGEDSNNIYFSKNLKLISKYDLIDPKNINLTVKFQWYVSKERFNLKYKKTGIETSDNIYFPIFPDDYDAIPGETKSTLSSFNKYTNSGGRHFVLTAIPCSDNGKMGSLTESNPVYVSGLPITDNLAMHLDANLITEDENIRTEGTGEFAIDYVKKWTDVSGNNIIVNQNESEKQPQLAVSQLKAKYEDRNTYSKMIVSNEKELKISGNAKLKLPKYTVFVVASTESDTQNTLIGDKNNSFKLDFNGFNSSIKLDKDNTQNLYIVSCDSDGKRSISPGNSFTGIPPGTLNGQELYVGGFDSKVKVAEIIMYNSVLSNADRDKVNIYLTEKYGL